MSGRDNRGRDRYDDRDRDRDRSRSYNREDRFERGRGGGGRGRGRGGGGGRGRGGPGGGRGGRGGRGGGGRGGAVRPPPVDLDRMQYPGMSDVQRIKAHNEVIYNPIVTQYCQLEDTEQRRAIDSVKNDTDLPVAKLSADRQVISGRKIDLVQNQFKIEIMDPERMVAIYSIEIKPLTQGKFDKPLKKEDNRNTIQNLSKELNCLLAYDGDKIVVSPQLLDGIDSHCLRVTNDGKRGSVMCKATCSSQKKPRDCEIRMSKVHELNFTKIQAYLNKGMEEVPTDVMQVIDIILKSDIANKSAFVNKGRSMFVTQANLKARPEMLIEGRECWHGLVQSTRISSWKEEVGSVNHLIMNLDLSYSLVMTDATMDVILKDFRDEFSCLNSVKHLTFECDGKYYKIDGFSRQPLDVISFRDDNGRNISLVDFWNRKLQDQNRPRLKDTRGKAIRVRKGKGAIEFPAELCKLVPGQKPKVESEKHKAALIRATAKPAPERLATLENMIQDPNLYQSSHLEKEFGIRIAPAPMEAQGHVLETPTILDGENKEIKVANGAWSTKRFFTTPTKELKWISIYLNPEEHCQLSQKQFENEFCKAFVNHGTSLGIPIGRPLLQRDFENYREFFKFAETCKRDGKNLADLNFILICGGNSGEKATDDYRAIKVLAELNLGALTQFVRYKSVLSDLSRNSTEVCHGLWLKLNEKLGNTNWKVDVPLPPSSVPIMVVGCSFTHSEAGSEKPTIVGFSASTKQGATNYVNMCLHQDPRLPIIPANNIRKAFEFMIGEFKAVNNCKPEKIIWYRGGASAGSIQTILKNEFMAIRKACSERDPDYQPGITFICSIRNHRQKMFAKHAEDRVGQGENVPAGTAMSGYGGGTPDSFHFHLCSHAGVGTVNPTFYQVLHDDNDLELDNVVKMTYALTLDSKRCEKSISEPAPVRLASLRAERGYNHWNGSETLCESLGRDDIRDALKQDDNKIRTRSAFSRSNFFI